jgi:hypothetical protein
MSQVLHSRKVNNSSGTYDSYIQQGQEELPKFTGALYHRSSEPLAQLVIESDEVFAAFLTPQYRKQ